MSNDPNSLKEYKARLKSQAVQTSTKFKFKIKHDLAIVKDVYDGDTITVTCEQANSEPNTFHDIKIRVAGIDTPEKRPKASATRTNESVECEKRMANHIAEVVKKKLLGKLVVISQLDSDDKYGRMMAHVSFIDRDANGANVMVDLSKWLIDQKFATPYDGGTKGGWEHLTTDYIRALGVPS
jgi:endonuclease YncB( thermonuclease family)